MESEQPILVNSKLERIDFDELVERCRKDTNRILADDDVGIVLYVGDLDIHTVTGVGHPKTGDAPPDPNGHWVLRNGSVALS